ncbi:hypothetical protein CEXT_487471 [Caerostris extrusa]|uniref:Uncharacterized protein n=1 Tax=Caerostris extrusa TaxID=172846 RepID=A0AAV4MKX8_CAEEX|nr:hypothetical protein CEXT_487471 [Caerostris extrusa]
MKKKRRSQAIPAGNKSHHAQLSEPRIVFRFLGNRKISSLECPIDQKVHLKSTSEDIAYFYISSNFQLSRGSLMCFGNFIIPLNFLGTCGKCQKIDQSAC